MSAMFIFQLVLIGLYMLLLVFSLQISWITIHAFWTNYRKKGIKFALKPLVVNGFVIGFVILIILSLPSMVLVVCQMLGISCEWLTRCLVGMIGK